MRQVDTGIDDANQDPFATAGNVEADTALDQIGTDLPDRDVEQGSVGMGGAEPHIASIESNRQRGGVEFASVIVEYREDG